MNTCYLIFFAHNYFDILIAAVNWIMKLAIIGHSYISDLKERFEGSEIVVENTRFEVSFFGWRGATFFTFLHNHRLLDSVISYNPDYLIVYLGGNDLKAQADLSIVKQNCRNFYQLLRQRLPTTCIIASQVELRFHGEKNKFDAPLVEHYKLLRRYLNKFILSLKCKDFLLRVESSGRLDNQRLYRDSVHLNSVGLNHLFKLMKDCLSYCYRNKRL